MNKSQSKYFNTAAKMDEAFLSVLEKKDFEYITVKEICEKAGVNRSTFYLHYETLGDLLKESVCLINERFVGYMKKDSASFIKKLETCPKNELYLVTDEYLNPYLNYVRGNKRIFRTLIENAETLQLQDSYSGLFRYVFTPILNRFEIPECDRGYFMAFYISGLMAIVTQWLKNDCKEPNSHIISVMKRCTADGRTEKL